MYRGGGEIEGGGGGDVMYRAGGEIGVMLCKGGGRHKD